MAHNVKATDTIVMDLTSLRNLCTMFTLMPYNKVANITKDIKYKLPVPVTPWLNNKRMLPRKPTIIPIILPEGMLYLNNRAPVTMANIGVREFNIPASALSIWVSAIQNR